MEIKLTQMKNFIMFAMILLHMMSNKEALKLKKLKSVLGFEALTTLEDALDEIIPWVSDQAKKGLIYSEENEQPH